MFQGKMKLLFAFESKVVRVFDFETGYFEDELVFMESHDATLVPQEDD